MENITTNATRKHGRHLRVPVLPDEENTIKSQAAQAGLSIAEYLRRCGLGHSIQGIIDQQHILELAKINADLGRLGGLLKLWLTLDNKTAGFDVKTIRNLLNRIQCTQQAMLTAVNRL